MSDCSANALASPPTKHPRNAKHQEKSRATSLMLHASVALATWWLAPAATVRGADDPQSAGSCVSESASIVRRPAGDTKWHIVAQRDALNSGDLLVGFPGSMVDSANGAVRLSLLADMDKTSPFPVLEAGVVLHRSPGADLDFTLDLGRV